MTPLLQRFLHAILVMMTIFTYAVSDQALAESETDLQSQITFYVH